MKRIIGTPKELKRVNTSLVIESIKNRENATRAEIVKDTGISQTTVSKLLASLEADNEIINVGFDKSSGGRRAERYSLNKNKNYILSVLINGQNLNYNLINSIGEVIESDIVKTEEVYDKAVLDDLITNIIKTYKNIKIIGIGVPGIISKDGYLAGTIIKDLEEINIDKYIEEKYNIPVILENDLNITALGFLESYIKDEANKIKNINMVYINFNKLGAGAGIIVRNKLIKGKDNFAGEVGFIKIGKHCVNELLLKNPNDDEYIDIVLNIVSIIKYIINPDFIVLGGNDFRYNLMNNIKLKSDENKITTEIYIANNENKFALEGITKIALDFINDDIKLLANV